MKRCALISVTDKSGVVEFARGLVEEGFPTEAVTDPMLWYKAEGSQERLQANLGRMIDSVRSFLDIDRVQSLPMSEYRC